MERQITDNQYWANVTYQTACGIAAVAGIFSLVITVLLIAHYLQSAVVSPLEHPALLKLIEKSQQNPDNQQVREQARALDLLARKAYFTTQAQIRAGGYLLLSGIVVTLLALKSMAALRRELPAPTSCPGPPNVWHIAAQTRKAIAVTGIVLALLAMPLAYLGQRTLSPDHFPSTNTIAADNKTRHEPDGSRPAQPQPAGQLAENLARPATTAGSDQARSPISVPQKSNAPIPLPQANNVASFASPEEMAGNWPGFRGPLGQGMTVATDAPTVWDGKSGKGILWSTAIARPGFNSPVVWKQQVFLSAADQKIREIYCFAAPTGKILWQHQVKKLPGTPEQPPVVTPDTGYAAPTMACDGRRVYALFATGDLVALMLDGKSVWGRNLGVPRNHYGHSSSLIVSGRLLLVQYDHDSGPRLLALDGSDGKTVWETKRDVEVSWASPMIFTASGQDRLVLTGSPVVTCYELTNGKKIWQTECLSGEVAPSPAYAGNRIFVTNVGAGLYALDAAGGKILWEFYDGQFPDVSSPVASGAYLFIASSSGVFTCLDNTTGKTLWTQSFRHGFYASPIVAGDKVYLLDKKGVMRICKVAASYQLVGENALGEDVVATPAFAAGCIYLRSFKHLFCIGSVHADK